jgi:hypothetical protein
MTDMVTEKLLSPAQAGKALGTHGRTVVRWALAGHVPYLKTPTGYFKFKEADILKLAESFKESGNAQDSG